MLRSVPTCPCRAGALKPVTSVAGKTATSSPMSSARLAPSAAQGHGDVVPRDTREARDVVGGAPRDLERLGGGIVPDLRGVL